MKKLLSKSALVLIIACLCAFCGTFALSASAATASKPSKLDDFYDDFESYETGKYIENTPSFASVWTNNVLSGGEAQGMDAHLTSVAKPEYETGTSGNKVLHVKNAGTALDSFFHIGPANDFRVKNFTVTFKVKFLAEDVAERSWVGVSFRKKAESAYTGTNNLMFIIQRYVSGNEITAHSYAIFNGGGENDLSDASVKSLYGDKIKYTTSTYKVVGGEGNKDLPWIEYKLVVNERNYATYVNETKVADCTFDVASYDYFGYLSLNCCMANVLVDDFKVEVQDETLPSVIGKLDTPVVTLNQEEKTVSWEKVSGATLYTVYVDGKAVKTSAKRTYTFEDDLSEGEHKVTVKAISDDTFVVRDSDMSDEVTYVVGGEKKGCGGSIGVAASLCPALLFGCALLKKKRG